MFYFSISRTDVSSLPTVCTEAVKLLESTPVCPEVADAILSSLNTLTDNNMASTHFAVRSSAAGAYSYDQCIRWCESVRVSCFYQEL